MAARLPPEPRRATHPPHEGEEERSVADLTWGVEPAPSQTLHPIADQTVPPEPPAPPLAKPAVGEAIQPTRNSLARLALVALCAIAAVLALYQFVLRPKKTAPPPPPPAIATIKFVVQPADAVVEVGGKEVGHASPFETQLGPGVYSIRVRKDGYKPWTTEVTLRDGDKPTVQVALDAGTAHLSLTSQPPGLAAQLDGKPLDQMTPIEMQVAAGAHTVIVTNAAGVTWTQSFTAEVDGKYTYVAPLTQTKRAAPPPVAAAARPSAPPPERERDKAERNDKAERGKRPGAPVRIATGKDAEAELRMPEPTPEPAPPSPRAESPAPAPAPPVEPARPARVVAAAPAAPKATPLVAPTAVSKLSGDIPAMKVAGVTEAFADVIAKMCIDDRGRVTSVKLIKALPEIAEELQRSLGAWRYKPYSNASGQASPACFPVSFRVVFKRSG
jgi:hypothetical protein